MQGKEENKLERNEAIKLRNILGDTKLRETHRFEFPEMMCGKLNEVLKDE